MAVAAPEVRSTPDLPKLNTMTARTLLVTRYAGRGLVGAHVGTFRNVNVERILGMNEELVRTHGPGTYRFEVSDEGGGERDVWMVKLGPDTPEIAAAASDGGTNGSNGTYSGEQLFPGWWYHEHLELLIGPRNERIRWKRGESLPTSLFQGGPAATPIGAATPIAAGPGWGTEDPRIKALEDALAREQEARREAEHKREVERIEQRFAEAQAQQNQRMEALMKELTAAKQAPAGPDPELVAVKAELERQRQANEARAREDALRAEMRAAEERTLAVLRELKEQSAAPKGPDPMMTLLAQMFSSSQAGAAEAARSIREAAANANEQSRQQMLLLADKLSAYSLTPMQMMAIQQGGSGSALAQEQAGLFRTMMGTVREMLEMRNDLQGGGDDPPWLGVVKAGMETVGRIGQTVAAAAAVRAQQQQAPQPQRRGPITVQGTVVPGQQPMMAPGQQVVPQVPVQPQRPMNSVEARDQIARTKFRDHGTNEREQMARTVGYDKPAPVPTADGTAPAAPAIQVVPAPAPEAGAAPPRTKPRRRPVPVQPAAAPPPPPNLQSVPPEPHASDEDDDEGPAAAGPEVVTPAELARMAPQDVYKLVMENAPSDDEFFSVLAAARLGELRTGAQLGQLAPDDVAAAVLEARAMLRGAGEYPPVLEILDAGQLVVVVERLLPQAPDAYKGAVVVAIAHALSAADGTDPQSLLMPMG